MKTLLKKAVMSNLKIEQTESLSPGTGLTLWCDSRKTVIGSTVLGERGVSSEEVGVMAASNILKEIECDSTLDVFAFDQMLPYMAIATDKGPSTVMVRELSNHAKTNMWLISKFFNANFEAVQNENNVVIKVR
jgi:RNA 3'-terminal phosphate cyclase